MRHSTPYSSGKDCRVSANHATNSSACSAHAFLSVARSVQDRLPLTAQKRRILSSHFIHLLLDGRIGRDAPISIAISCHEESLQAVTRQTQVLTRRLATWPAQCPAPLVTARCLDPATDSCGFCKCLCTSRDPLYEVGVIL